VAIDSKIITGRAHAAIENWIHEEWQYYTLQVCMIEQWEWTARAGAGTTRKARPRPRFFFDPWFRRIRSARGRQTTKLEAKMNNYENVMLGGEGPKIKIMLGTTPSVDQKVW